MRAPRRPKHSPKPVKKSKKVASVGSSDSAVPARLAGTEGVTLRDIARVLGVSHVTVSLALRNSPRIPAKRCQEVQKLAAKMGYQPNPMATALAQHRRASSVRPVAAALGWLNFWKSPSDLRKHAEFDAYWRGARRTAEKFGYRLDEFNCDGKSLTLARLQEILVSRGINGLLLPPQRTTLPLEHFDWTRFSTVRFGRSVERPRLHLVTADQVASAMRAFNAARDLGYKRVGFLDGGGYLHGTRFTAGFMLAQRFVPAGDRLPLFSVDQVNWRPRVPALIRWMKSAKPDAILTDFADAREMLAKAGYRVPEDVGLGAMSILDGKCDAGIDQHPEEIGRVAMLLLISLIHDWDRGEPPIFREILVEGAWVDGSMMPRRA